MHIPRFGMHFNNQVSTSSKYHERVSQLKEAAPKADDGLELTIRESTNGKKKTLTAEIYAVDFRLPALYTSNSSRFPSRVLKPHHQVELFLQNLVVQMERCSAQEVKKRTFLKEQTEIANDRVFGELEGLAAGVASRGIPAAVQELQYAISEFQSDLPSEEQDALRIPGFTYKQNSPTVIAASSGTAYLTRTISQRGSGINIAQAAGGGRTSHITQYGEPGGRFLAYESNGHADIRQKGDRSMFIVDGANGASKVNQKGNESRFLYIAGSGETELEQCGDNSIFTVQGRDGTYTKVDYSRYSEFSVIGGAVELYGAEKDWQHDAERRCYTHRESQSRVFVDGAAVSFARKSNPITDALNERRRFK